MDQVARATDVPDFLALLRQGPDNPCTVTLTTVAVDSMHDLANGLAQQDYSALVPCINLIGAHANQARYCWRLHCLAL